MIAIVQKRGTVAAVAAILLVSILLLSLLGPSESYQRISSGLETLKDVAHHASAPHDTSSSTPTNGSMPPIEKLAIVTFLSGTLDKNDDDWETDEYFQATRLLAWQLLHSNSTKIRRPGLDFYVAVTPSVSPSRRDRLERDGARLWPVDFLYAEWLHDTNHEMRWDDLMGKLRVWQMVEYSRILLLDGDIILLEPLDGVFDDPGAQFHRTNRSAKGPSLLPEGEEPPLLPDEYVLGGTHETIGPNHVFPPTFENNGLQKYGYFNAGFFLLAPNLQLFEYYTRLMNTKDGFDAEFMEQNLLNRIHSWDGPLPWTLIDVKWNMVAVTDEDLDAGVKSMHQKWFRDPTSGSQRVRDIGMRMRWEMQGWYDAIDLVKTKEVS